MIRRRTHRGAHKAPKHPDALVQLEELADSTVALAEQIKATVAELRRQDTRGHQDDE